MLHLTMGESACDRVDPQQRRLLCRPSISRISLRGVGETEGRIYRQYDKILVVRFSGRLKVGTELNSKSWSVWSCDWTHFVRCLVIIWSERPCRRSGVNDHQRSQSARLKERSFLPLKPFPNFVICHRLVPGASSGAPGHGPSGSSGSRDGHRSAFDLGADFPVLPDLPEVPWLRFAREVTTEDAKPSSEATSGLLGGMLTTAVSCDAGTVPLEVVNAGSMELNHIRSLVECPPDDAQPSAETTLPGNMLTSAVSDTNAAPREVTIADVSKLHQTPEDEALEGVFTVASEVPKVSVCDCSCESKSVFPVDAPAAKRLKVTPTQHDSIDATPCRGQHTVSPSPRTRPSILPCWKPQPPPTFPVVSQNYSGQRHSAYLPHHSAPPSHHEVFMGVPAIFCLPPASVSSSLLLYYLDSEGDSCTLTAATFPDALPLFLPDHVVRLTAAATHRNIRASPPSPHSPPSASGSSPRPFAQANVYTPPRHVMARLEADRSRHSDDQNKDQDAALARWRNDHHSDPLSLLAMQALFDLFPDEPSKGIEVLRSLQTDMPHPLGHPPRVPGATWFPSQPTRSSFCQCPVPGSWTADEILSAAKRIFRNPGLAWTITPGAGRHRQVRTNFAIINHWNTGAVNVQGGESHMVSNQIQSTRPGPVCAPTTPDPSRYFSRRKRNTHPTVPTGPPTDWRHPIPTSPFSSPVPIPSLNTGPFSPLAQPDTELFENHSSVAQHPGHQVPRRRPVTQGPHASAAFLRMAATFQMETCLATPDPSSFWYF